MNFCQIFVGIKLSNVIAANIGMIASRGGPWAPILVGGYFMGATVIWEYGVSSSICPPVCTYLVEAWKNAIRMITTLKLESVPLGIITKKNLQFLYW